VFNSAAFTNPSSASAIVLGTSPRVNSGYRTPLFKNEDFSITKYLVSFGQYGTLQLHVDLFNAFNRVHLGGLVTDPNVGNFGAYTSDFGAPTIRQFILRYSF
jgi:hypothetical protein